MDALSALSPIIVALIGALSAVAFILAVNTRF
jgi:hypothetical protein